MSRARQNSTGRLRLAPAVSGLGLVAVLALTGCSAGQITQTDTMEAAVNGGMGKVGTIAVRDVRLAYPKGGAFPLGGDAPMIGTLVNSGQTDDELIAVESPVGTAVISGDKSMPAGRALFVEASHAEPTTSSSVATTTSQISTSGAATSGAATSGAATSGAATSGAAATTSVRTSGANGASSTTPTSTTTTTTTTSAKPTSIGKLSITLTKLTTAVHSGKTVPVTFVFRSGRVTVEVPVEVPEGARKPVGGHGTEAVKPTQGGGH